MSERYGGPGVAEVLAELARALESEHGMEATLNAAVDSAVGTVPGAEFAGVIEVKGRRRVQVRHATDDLIRSAEAVGEETGEGPCLDAVFEQRTVSVPDLAADTRWPAYSARVADLGIGSMLAFQLYVQGDSLGALTLYSRRVGAFDEESEQIGLMFAAHTAVAMARVRKEEQLTTAIDSRDVIGQAKGILMERYRIPAPTAFTLLIRASQRSDLKLVQVARHLTETHDLPACRSRPAPPRDAGA